MRTPYLEIDLSKIEHNAKELRHMWGKHSIEVMGITKVDMGEPHIANALKNAGITMLGDSRIEDIIRMQKSGIEATYVLIRTPFLSDVKRVVKYADISFNTELSVIKALSKEALKIGKSHKIVLMVEMGDRREGILPEDLDATIEEVLNLKGIKLEGLGANFACFGSSQKASQLEASKSYAKAFLKRHNIPTPEYEVFTDAEAALSYLEKKEAPIVVKADGLASGKGVIVALSIQEAKDAVIDMLEENRFGSAGSRVVIEEYMEGEECSFVIMSDGNNILPMAPCQDHKRKGEGDTGVNTGGMGAYSPVKSVTPELNGRILKEIVQPTIDAMREKEHIPYMGFLYTGIMIDKNGDPKVLEFNCRFGDPEAQPTMMCLQSDFAEHIVAALEGRLDKEVAQWDEQSALCVVLAPKEYPEKFQGGAVICGLEKVNDPNIKIFHSGTTRNNKGEIITTVGRTLSVTALGDSIEDAQKRAYEAVKKIDFEGIYYRKDIGCKALRG